MKFVRVYDMNMRLVVSGVGVEVPDDKSYFVVIREAQEALDGLELGEVLETYVSGSKHPLDTTI